MAELYIIGQIVGAKDFRKKSLFCKWGIHSGSGWQLIAGSKEGQTQVDHGGYDGMTYWSHPIDIHFATKGIPGWPKIYLQIFHYDEFGRSEVCGYGYCYVPTTPGSHLITCPTWKPVVYVMLLVSYSKMQMNGDTPTTESACENVSSTCFPLSADSFVTEVSVQTTESEVLLTTFSKTAIEVNSTTTTVENASPSTTTPKPDIKKTIKDHCHCDMMPDNCDINCCCDLDCKDWERVAFSSCTDVSPSPNYGQCISSDVIYRNNTPYPITRNNGGLLCISKDNFPERNAYVEQDVIKSLQKFEKVWGRKKHYYWNPPSEKQIKIFEKTDLYKVGEPIWKYNNDTDEAVIFDIPAKISSTSLACRNKKHVSYLQKMSSSCLQLIPTSEQECTSNYDFSAKNFCQDLVFVASPSLVNSSTQLQDISDEAFIKVRQELCSDGNCKEVIHFPEPIYNKEKNLCHNVLLKLLLLIRHNGSLGITEAVCKISLGTTSSKNRLFEQRFEVDFLSAYFNASLAFYRSGTPGYREGMPIITNIQKKNNKKKTRTSLTVVSGENCNELTSLLFKENSRIQCSLRIPVNLTHNCSLLEEQIMNRMISGIGEIGVTGDPDTWLEPTLPLVTPLILKATCVPVSVLSLHFLFAYSGPLFKPVAKIVGFKAQFDRSLGLNCPKLSEFCTLKLVTMTTFIDVSKPVVSKYASAPVVKIKLPQDFFYPFSSRAWSNLTCNLSFVVFTVISHFVYIFCV